MKALVLSAALALGPQPPAGICPVEGVTKIASQSYCCTRASGQQCCSRSLDNNGKPAGCGC